MKNKRLNTVTFDGQTYTAPAGYVFLNIEDEIRKGDSVFSTYGDNSIEDIEDLKYRRFALNKGTKQSINMIPSIRKIRVRKVGPVIPDGYRIIKGGEVIPEGYYYRDSGVGSKDLDSWTKNADNMCAGQVKILRDSLWIAPIIPPVPPVPKIYNIELSSNQVKILSILLNNNDKTLNNWFNQSSNYYIEKTPELIGAADNEFKKAGLNENCIWNKLYQITKQNIQDFPKK